MIKRDYLLFLILVPAVIALSGCARQLRNEAGQPLDDASMVQAALSGAAIISEFKGFGDITLTQAGRRASGTIEAVRRNTGFLKAQVYTPFGSAIASIIAEEFAGRVAADGQTLEFTYDDTMDEAPFPCARRLTYGRFINSITGSMPEAFWELPSEPDTLTRSKKRGAVTAAWFSDTLTVRAQVSSKTGALQTVTFNYDIGGDKFSMRFGSFKKGAPHEILIRENSKNYISISYESIVWK